MTTHVLLWPRERERERERKRERERERERRAHKYLEREREREKGTQILRKREREEVGRERGGRETTPITHALLIMGTVIFEKRLICFKFLFLITRF